MKLHLVNKLWKVTGYNRNRGSEKERVEMSISEGEGKGKTKNGSGIAKVSLYLPECSPHCYNYHCYTLCEMLRRYYNKGSHQQYIFFVTMDRNSLYW